jgi:hypothetical protein
VVREIPPTVLLATPWGGAAQAQINLKMIKGEVKKPVRADNTKPRE